MPHNIFLCLFGSRKSEYNIHRLDEGLRKAIRIQSEWIAKGKKLEQ